MPSHRPTGLGPVPASRDNDDEAPTRSGFGATGDDERTAVDDGAAQSLLAAASSSADDNWDNKPTVARKRADGIPRVPAGLSEPDSVQGTVERTADGSRTMAAAHGSAGMRTHPRVAPRGKGMSARAGARGRDGAALATAHPRFASDGDSVDEDRITSNPSTVVDDAGDRPTDDDGARPLPPLSVIAGGGGNPGALSAPAPAPAAALLVIGGNDRGRRFDLGKSLLTIGRAVDNDVVLTDISVSRHHLAIAFDGQQFVARDLGSGNGTLINQRERAAAALVPGDQLELGNTLVRFEAATASAGPGRPVLELGDDQSTVAERPRGLRAMPPARAASHGSADDEVPHVSAAAAAAEPLEPLGGAGSISQVAPRARSNADVETHSTDSVVAASADLHKRGRGADPGDRRLRRRIYFAAVLFGLIVALAVAGGGEATEDPSSALVAENELAGDGAAAAVDPREATGDSEAAGDVVRPADGDGRDDGRDNDDTGPSSDAPAAAASALGDTDRGDDGDDRDGDGDDRDGDGDDAPVRPDNADNDGEAQSGDDDRPGVRRNTGPQAARRQAARRDNRKADRNRPARATATDRQRGNRPDPAVDKAAELYKARQFSSAAKSLRAAADDVPAPAARKLKAQASAYEAVGKHLAAGDADKRTNAPGAMVAYRKALSLDRKSGGGVHGTYIRLRLRDVAPRAAGAFMAQRRYEAAKRAADEAVSYGAGSDPMVKRVRAALARKAEDYYRAGLANRSKNAKLAAANFKRAMSLVPQSDPLYGKARAALNR